MTPQKLNLFEGVPNPLSNEFLQTVAESDSVRVERIISCGEGTAAGEWYDQDWDEWVLLISGNASLLFYGEPEPFIMQPGDHVLIPANCLHRVESTSSEGNTVWLAVHFKAET